MNRLHLEWKQGVSLSMAVGLALVALGLLLSAPALASDGVANSSTASAHLDLSTMETCFATVDGIVVYSSTNATAVQQAVDAASPGATIMVAGYCAGVQQRGGMTQTVYISKSLTLRGGYTTTWMSSNPISYPTVLDGMMQGRVVFITGTGGTIENLDVQNGYVNNEACLGESCGGGIYADGDLALSSVNVLSNTAAGFGGGVWANGAVQLFDGLLQNNRCTYPCLGGGLYTEDTLAMTDTWFTSNRATHWGGGAYARGVTQILGGLFQNNRANSGGGGGLYVDNAVLISGTQFLGNVGGDRGGGVCVGGPTRVISSFFQDNQSGLQGGGLYVSSWFSAAITSTRFISNAAGAGGGAFVRGPVWVSGGLFERNTAENGYGGLYAQGALVVSGTGFISNTAMDSYAGGAGAIGNTEISGALFQNNASHSFGGGLRIDSGGTLTVTGSQFISNTSTKGGGGISAGRIWLSDSLFENNQCTEDGCYGGGLSSWAHPTVSSTQFLSNTAVGYGGGAFVQGVSRFSDSLFQGNRCIGSGLGGGLYATHDSLSMTNTQVISNAAFDGGGVYIASDEATLFETQLLSNTASSTGGAVYNADASSSVTITYSCIVANSETSMVNPSLPTLHATNNWWGAENGPSGAGPGSGDSISTNVDYSGFMTQTFSGCPSLPPANLTIIKSVTPTLVGPGRAVTYTLRYSSAGGLRRTATGIIITDAVPITLTGLVYSKSGPAITPTGSISYAWQVANLAPGTSGIITISGVVSSSVSGTFSLTNQAIITAAAANAAVNGATPIVSNTVDATPPSAPTLINPVDGTIISFTGVITFAWQASPDPDVDGYLLNLDGTMTDTGNVTQYSIPVPADGVYTWTVAAYDTFGNTSLYTDAWSLAVDTVEPQIITVVPVSGAVDMAIHASIVVTFSEAISTGTLVYTTAPDPGGWSALWGNAGKVVTLTHALFTNWTTYTITVTAASDLAGHQLTDLPYAWRFATVPCRTFLPFLAGASP